MPGRGHRPDDRGDQTIPRILIASFLLVALTVAASCQQEESEPGPQATTAPRLGIAAATRVVDPAYGAIVPMEFTVTNLGRGTCRLERLEALVGGRWEMWRADEEVPIPEGQSRTITVSYRLLTPEEDMLVSFEPPDSQPANSQDSGRGSGQIVRERKRVPIPCPPEPFDSQRLQRSFESWTYSTALDGFVYRGNEWTFTLVRKDGSTGLPPLPFRFLKDIDLHPDGVAVVMDNEEVRTITPDALADFLTGLRARGARLTASREPDRAPYEVRR